MHFCPCGKNDTKQSLSANFSSQLAAVEYVKTTATAGGSFLDGYHHATKNYAMPCLSFGFDGIVAYTEPRKQCLTM